MHVIGTAGHVDHGKSALVLALTGIDPDRLEEEKRRGLTIDLGFAWLRLPSGREVGIVDVPGHERFIRNMLAGAGAINATLFVVAANEGWKPQSQEHLDILDLLGVSTAIVAVTKADTVERARLDEVAAEVRAKINATALAEAPILTVSATSGDGIGDLVAAIERLLRKAPPAEDRQRPRLWIDRVFSMRGSGTVVTGTLVEGELRRHQEIEILPAGLRARIRSIQSHRREVEAIAPGNRTALNLTGLDVEQIRRGDVATLPGLWHSTDRVAASIRFLPHLGHDPTEKGAFKFYAGSAEADAAIRFLGTPPEFAVISLDRPIVLDWGDRFVLRDAGRRETLGGGVVLEPHLALRRPDGDLSDALRRRAAADRPGYLAIVLREEGSLRRAEVLPRGGIAPAESEALVDAVWLPSFVVSTEAFEDWRRSLVEAVRTHQKENPLEAGIPRSTLRSALDLDPKLFDEVVEELEKRAAIVGEETAVRTPDHSPAVGGPERGALLAELEKGGASPPTLDELQMQFDPALVRALVRSGELTQVSPELVYPTSWIGELKAQIAAEIGRKGPLTVATFRDLLGTTRKYAVPLLEYLDHEGFTRRQGDVRVLGPKA